LLSNGQSTTSKHPEKHLDEDSLLNPPRNDCQAGEPREKHTCGGLGRGSVVPWLCPKNVCKLKFLLHIVAVCLPGKPPHWGGGNTTERKHYDKRVEVKHQTRKRGNCLDKRKLRNSHESSWAFDLIKVNLY